MIPGDEEGGEELIADELVFDEFRANCGYSARFDYPGYVQAVSAHGCGLGSWGDRLLELRRRESRREEVLWRLRERARFGLFFLRRR